MSPEEKVRILSWRAYFTGRACPNCGQNSLAFMGFPEEPMPYTTNPPDLVVFCPIVRCYWECFITQGAWVSLFPGTDALFHPPD